MQIYADIFNRSSDAVQYLISFKRPKQIIDRYRFNVELVCHLPTSMHASGEGHQCATSLNAVLRVVLLPLDAAADYAIAVRK